MARSHGHRSSSVRGWPEDIFAMLASGWNASPSANSQPIAVAIPCAIVVLPDPDTPITMMMSFIHEPYAQRGGRCLRTGVDAGREELMLGVGVVSSHGSSVRRTPCQ